VQGIIKNEILEEDIESTSLRPQGLDEFIGQEHLKDQLSIALQASKKRGDAMDHTLFYGPPGLGKTTLSGIIAKELGVNFKATSGPIITKAGDLAAMLTNVQKNDVFFIDEIHRLNISVEEMLYSAMEDFTVDILIGEGPSARSVKINLPPFTLIGATTRFGLLSTPLRSRFGIICHLEFYSTVQLMEVVLNASNKLGFEIAKDATHEIAMRARGTPRIALRLLRRVRDFAEIRNAGIIDTNAAKKALDMLGIDTLGLDSNDIRYLKYIAVYYNGGPVGIETIAAGLSMDKGSIEDIIEPYLMQIGFLQRTPRGRTLTKQAISYIATQ
jgi:Holliday junction DNA helicase RuvB